MEQKHISVLESTTVISKLSAVGREGKEFFTCSLWMMEKFQKSWNSFQRLMQIKISGIFNYCSIIDNFNVYLFIESVMDFLS